MDWRIKALLISIHRVLPYKESIYYYAQKKFGGLREDIISKRWCGIKDIFLLAQKYNIPQDMDVFEIGTGRYPLFPSVFFMMGAKSILSYDVAKLMRRDLTKIMTKSLKAHLREIRAELRLIDERVNQIDKVFAIDNSIFTYKAPADARNTELPSGSFDFVYSNAVLEHVEKRDVVAIHNECYRIIKEDGWLLHNIDLSDHFSHSDRRLSKINFLKFTERKWNVLTKNSFFYQNRLRASQHLSMLKDCGFEIVDSKIVIDPSDLSAIEDIPLAAEFGNFSRDDCATTRLLLLARRVN